MFVPAGLTLNIWFIRIFQDLILAYQVKSSLTNHVLVPSFMWVSYEFSQLSHFPIKAPSTLFPNFPGCCPARHHHHETLGDLRTMTTSSCYSLCLTPGSHFMLRARLANAFLLLCVCVCVWIKIHECCLLKWPWKLPANPAWYMLLIWMILTLRFGYWLFSQNQCQVRGWKRTFIIPNSSIN